MKTLNAIKKIEKVTGEKVISDGRHHQVQANGQILSFYSSSMGEVQVINVRYETDKDNSHEDYSAGAFYDNIGQAIKWGLFHGVAQ